jgi:hypothetical protein
MDTAQVELMIRSLPLSVCIERHTLEAFSDYSISKTILPKLSFDSIRLWASRT